jgi:hypothetical protein
MVFVEPIIIVNRGTTVYTLKWCYIIPLTKTIFFPVVCDIQTENDAIQFDTQLK